MALSQHHGLLVLDKPHGITSRDAVDRAQGWFPRGTRIGHTGTLDPLATGVLVLCVGHATRLTEYVQDMAKTYVADVRLGARSVTDDAEGPITVVAVDQPPDRLAIDASLASFIGEVAQVPPAFSAAKIDGRRAYALARRGEAVELSPRTVRIDGIDVLKFAYPEMTLEVRCGKGTYIRSLVRDLGELLGCGAYLTGLRRTHVGSFAADDAVPLDADPVSAQARLQPLTAAVADLPRVTLAPQAAIPLRHGRLVAWPESEPPLSWSPGLEVAVMDEAGALVAIATIDDKGLFLRPTKVFQA